MTKATIVLFAIPTYPRFHAIKIGDRFWRLDAHGSGRFHEFRPIASQRLLAKRSRLADVSANERPYFQGLARGSK